MNKKMNIRYDLEADALYIKLKEGKFKETREDGDYLVDYDDKGEILGIEVLFCSRKFSGFKKKIALEHVL